MTKLSTRPIYAGLAAATLALFASTALSAQTAPAAPAAASTQASEDARLTQFLDAEFAAYVKTQPQLATRLGIKDDGDKWSDISDAAADAQVAWRQPAWHG